MEKALLVTIEFKQDKETLNIEDSAVELEELSSACKLETLDSITCICHKPTPNFLIGRGKVEEIGVLAQELDINAIILSRNLSGTQQRNLEEVWGKKTIDRTQLILDIFARRAKSPEGKMQVELAQLEYLTPRLTGKGVILSRQGGGVGTSGPGEKKLEVGRRKIRERINRLRKDLEGVSRHRALIRKKRKNEAILLIALVGYTSAGKSTLLNALTEAGQFVSENMFATLDPLARSVKLPSGARAVFSDTVGFLRDLPHNLIDAFKATLEEVTAADLLIHVLDASSPQVHDKSRAVMEVLRELNADNKPMITALNKIDLLPDQMWLKTLISDFVNPVTISAKLKVNLDLLIQKIESAMPDRMVEVNITIPHQRMDLIDLFYRQGRVEDIRYLQKGIKVKARLPSLLHKKILSDKDILANC
ncbi:MAG: GTPase HflX [Candidatus Omnitrophica bacterium]|nr:GTPase HflX [Candidatus Omnitrophota bacterium]